MSTPRSSASAHPPACSLSTTHARVAARALAPDLGTLISTPAARLASSLSARRRRVTTWYSLSTELPSTPRPGRSSRAHSAASVVRSRSPRLALSNRPIGTTGRPAAVNATCLARVVLCCKMFTPSEVGSVVDSTPAGFQYRNTRRGRALAFPWACRLRRKVR